MDRLQLSYLVTQKNQITKIQTTPKKYFKSRRTNRLSY